MRAVHTFPKSVFGSIQSQIQMMLTSCRHLHIVHSMRHTCNVTADKLIFEPFPSPKTRLFYIAQVLPTETDAQPCHDTVPLPNPAWPLRFKTTRRLIHDSVRSKRSTNFILSPESDLHQRQLTDRRSLRLIVPMRRATPLIGQRGFCVAK